MVELHGRRRGSPLRRYKKIVTGQDVLRALPPPGELVAAPG
jgi:hypothetical protein